MARSRKSATDETTASAQVFLRTKSGRSLRELASSPLPKDLAPYRPPATAVNAVVHHLEACGFQVLRDEMGLALTIQGRASIFAKVFGVARETVIRVRADTTVRLRAPPEIERYVDEIVMTPRPEPFR